MRYLTYIITLALTLVFSVISSKADVTVSTSQQLRQLLSQDQDFGNIYLTATNYVVDDIEVKAGGTLRPKGNGRVTFLGANHSIKINAVGISEKPLPDFKRSKIFLITNGNYIEEPVNQPVVVLGSTAIEQIDAETRSIRIKVNGELAGMLKGLSQAQLSYTLGKLSMWFHCADMTGLYYKDGYVYGNLDSNQYYNAIPYVRKHTKTIALCLFNLPTPGTTYVDTRGYLHTPKRGVTLVYFYKEAGLRPSGARTLKIQCIDFVGTATAIPLAKRAANKTIESCTFRNCNTGIVAQNGDNNIPTNITVKNCRFIDLYHSVGVMLRGCDNSTIVGNEFERTGLINRSGAVIDVTGNNYVIRNNTIKAFTYNGIRIGQNREYGVMQNSGIIEGNLIDNRAYYRDSSKCLNDGGGIYIFTHQDDTKIRGNVICNIGYDTGGLRGIMMDDGAYNTTVTGNLIYNIYGSYALDSREVTAYARHNGNDMFTDNVIVGSVRIGAPTNPEMANVVYTGNYVDGTQTLGKDRIDAKGNVAFKAVAVTDNGLIVDKQTYKKLKKRLSPFVMKYISK